MLNHHKIIINNTIGKPWQELTIADVDDYLTAKRLAGIMPETYNHYYGALRFMYKPVLKLNWNEDEIPRMKLYSNQQLLYDAMYHCVSETINELTADTKHLGAKVGYICVLHTWGSEMNYHPHIHVILLGGGLAPPWKATTANTSTVLKPDAHIFRNLFCFLNRNISGFNSTLYIFYLFNHSVTQLTAKADVFEKVFKPKAM